MKKFFIALSVLAALMLSVVPSQALVGIPDDVPGNEAVVPFIADISGTTGLNTLIAFMDVGLADGINFHYTIHTVRSETVYNDDLVGTKGDIVATDAFTEIGKMAPVQAAKLAVDIDGDGVNDHYAGYIYYDAVLRTANSVVGQFYFVDLANGIAASANIPMKEYHANLATATYQAQMAPGFIELFSPNAMAGARDLQLGLAAPNAAVGFGMYPRFFINASGDSTWLLFWMSANDLITALVSDVDFWDTEENNVSTAIPIDDELTIIDIEPYLPAGIFPLTTYAKEGWIQVEWLTPTAALQNMEILGWSYQQASGGPAASNWTVLTPIWRDVF